jgi:rsbT co-antagonist protein RsbR
MVTIVTTPPPHAHLRPYRTGLTFHGSPSETLMAQSHITSILVDTQAQLLSDWIDELARMRTVAGLKPDTGDSRGQAAELLGLIGQAASSSDEIRMDSEAWQPVRRFLEELSASRARQGQTSSQTATFVFSLKRPLFMALRTRVGNDAQTLADETWKATEMLDQLGLLTVAAYQRTREEVIVRQQEDMLELSTPVVKLWDGILALPMIGTLDSARTQVVMESLLQRIVETGAEIAILDITGVPTVDTLVAQHLLKTVTAIRLMGGDCIISGVRPQIAQTIVHLGVDLQGITTKASLADALALALRRTGQGVVKIKAPAATVAASTPDAPVS